MMFMRNARQRDRHAQHDERSEQPMAGCVPVSRRSPRVRRRLQVKTFVAILALALTGAVAGSAAAAVSQLTLDRTAQLSPGRLHAALTGIVTCDAGTTAFLSGRIIQPRNTSGFGSTSVACDGKPQTYAIDVSTSGPGVFKPGKANADVSSFQCDPPDFVCNTTFTDAKITLLR
jgi:hypothetical protein